MQPGLALKVAVLDRDSGFVAVLTKRMERLEWRYRVLRAKVAPGAVASINADAVVADLAVLEPGCWSWLTRVCRQPRRPGVIICAAGATTGDRVRALRLG